MDTAQHLLKDSTRSGPPGRYVRDRAQCDRLQAAAGRAVSRQLQEVLSGGIGFHHAAMEAQDRALVEACFLDRSILVRATRQCSHQVQRFLEACVLDRTKSWCMMSGSTLDSGAMCFT